MAKRNIKIFSHNDLDGFGAPVLVKTVQDVMFPDAEFDLTSIGAGRIDSELDYWFKSPEAATATDVWIMDMTPDSEHTMQELSLPIIGWFLTTMRLKRHCGKSLRLIRLSLLMQKSVPARPAWYGIGLRRCLALLS